MFSEIPKLIDRNFLVGFFMPSALFNSGLWFVLGAYGLVNLPKNLDDISKLSGTILAIIVVWLTAILFVALNRPILRFFEGYPLLYIAEGLGRRSGAIHTRWLRRFCSHVKFCRKITLSFQHEIDDYRAMLHKSLLRNFRRSFRSQARAELRLQNVIDMARLNGNPEPFIPPDYSRRLRQAVERFPDQEEYILPTRLGNLFRSFEVYSNVLYGLDAIPAWPRLQAVMPEHARKMIADAKAQLDFCLNVSTSGAVITLSYCVISLWSWQFLEPWLALISILFTILGYRLALSAATVFGGYIKSAFDLYRIDLAKALGLELPRSVEAERAMWSTVSRMMIYRSAARAAELTRYRDRRGGAT